MRTVSEVLAELIVGLTPAQVLLASELVAAAKAERSKHAEAQARYKANKNKTGTLISGDQRRSAVISVISNDQQEPSPPPQVSFPLYNPLPSFPPSTPKKPPVPRETGPYSLAFEEFWKGYPRTPVMSKKEALSCWKRLSSEDQGKASSAVPRYREFLRSKPDHPAVHACRFLSQRRFDGFVEEPELSVGYWIGIDTPEWEAWTQYRGRPFPPDKKGGWTVMTQWPPGWSNGRVA